MGWEISEKRMITAQGKNLKTWLPEGSVWDHDQETNTHNICWRSFCLDTAEANQTSIHEDAD